MKKKIKLKLLKMKNDKTQMIMWRIYSNFKWQ